MNNNDNIRNYIKGWLIGNFEPSIINSKEIEVGIKKYSAGQTEKEHVHNVSIEYTIVISGRIEMMEQEFSEGDIVIVNPSIPSSFKCIEDCNLLVIKSPSIPGDKYDL